jgi:hypothetical protein
MHFLLSNFIENNKLTRKMQNNKLNDPPFFEEEYLVKYEYFSCTPLPQQKVKWLVP